MRYRREKENLDEGKGKGKKANTMESSESLDDLLCLGTILVGTGIEKNLSTETFCS
jgi:hypothetical protein